MENKARRGLDYADSREKMVELKGIEPSAS